MHILLLLVISAVSLSAVKPQDLKVSSATVQVTNHGAAPGQTYNYTIEFSKRKRAVLIIDSITSRADKKPVAFTLSKNNQPVADNKIAAPDKSAHRVRFGIFKPGETDRRGRPVENNPSEAIDLSQGVTVHYRLNNTEKEQCVTRFKELAPLDTP